MYCIIHIEGMDYDVIVAGGGPAGSYIGSLLQESLNVLVLESKKSPGGKACSGLVSKDIRKFIPVDGLIENEIDFCKLYSPSGKKAELSIKQGTFALDRDELDSFLASKIKNIKFETKVESVEIKDCVKVKTNKGEFNSKMVVGADGNNSIVRGFWDVKPIDSVLGLMTMVEEKDCSGFFEVWFDSEIVKDGFLWRIPRGERVEYGVLGANVKFDVMEDFFKIKSGGLGTGKVYKAGFQCACERRASPIPTGFHKTFFDKTILVGDAAAQTKPWSFGGIYYGMVCGKIGAETIKKAFEKNNFSEKSLEEYEIKWKAQLEKSISMGMMFREFYQELDNKKIDQCFEVMKKAGIKELDMDHPLTNIFWVSQP